MPPKHKNKTNTAQTEIKEKLVNIYRDDDGKLPNLQEINRKKYSLSSVLIGLVTVVIIGVVIFGIYVFFGKPKTNFFTNDDVRLEVIAPDTVAIGGALTYEIYYKAQSKDGLEKARLQLNYPKGFVISTTTPAASNSSQTLWNFEELNYQSEGKILITGRLFGEQKQEQSLRVFFDYQPKNFKSEFQKVVTVKTMTDLSPIQLSIEGPDKPTAGRENLYSIIITNIHEESIENLILKTPSDSSWLKEKTQGIKDIKNVTEHSLGLKLPVLEKDAKWRMYFAVNLPVDQEYASSTLSWQIVKNISDNLFTIAGAIKEVKSETTGSQVQLLVNGKSDEVVIQPGEFLTFSIFYQNNGTVDLENMELKIVIDAPSAQEKSIFDWPRLVETHDAQIIGKQLNSTTRRGVITWTKDETPALKKIAPGEQGIINFQLPIKSDPQVLDAYNGFQAQVEASAAFQSGGRSETMSSKDITIFFNSDTRLTTILTNSSEPNTYLMLWQIDNSWHSIKNVRVASKLFGDIEWVGTEGVTPGGNLSYDAKTGSVVWNVSEMPPEVGVLALEFKFKLKSKNPTQTALFDKTTLTAIDVITNKPIVIENAEIQVP